MKITFKAALRALAIITAVATIYSFMPVVGLYLMKDRPVVTNAAAVEKLDGRENGHFAFLVFGDNHAGLIFNDSATLKLVRSMNREDRFRKVPIDFVISTGDITFRGRPWHYRVFSRIRSLIKWPVICAAGNHDDDFGGRKRFGEYAGSAEFAFSDRNSYFIFADSSSGELSDEQFARLERELRTSAGYAHRFVILHKSPVSLYHRSWYRPELSPWSYRFMKLCEKYRVDMVFSGHEHMTAAREFGGVTYITGGGGGMLTTVPSCDGGVLHYLFVRVYGGYADYEVRKVFPPLWEFLSYYMWKDVFYFVKDVIY